jgi:hydroxyacylglutathione hydrolase
MQMRSWLIVAAILAVPADAAPTRFSEKVWIHGSEDCASNRDLPIDVLAFDATTYVLRQNKCVHFEAPFIYVLIGDHTVFVQDTGATAEADRFPLYQVVHDLVGQRERTTGKELRILVAHSHSHGDHTAGDAQFHGQPRVSLVEPTAEAVSKHFGFAQWPQGQSTLDLGGRALVFLPIPGHQEESLAVYDQQTGWLLTGDTLYPGRLYVNDWVEYKASIRRLVDFSRSHTISAVMGTHIEMSATGELFPPGSTYQPNEAPLALTVGDLLLLNQRLDKSGDEPTELKMDKFAVVPIGTVQRMLGRILKVLGVR